VATCIETADGDTVWQRQLGFVCAQEPVVLGDHLLAIDKLGGFFHLDLKKVPDSKDAAWVTAGEWLANGADENAAAQLVAAPDGRSAVAVIFAPRSERVTLRKYDVPNGLQPELNYRLDSPPAGNAVLTDRSVIVPCRDGTLREFPLAGARELPLPLTWRDRTASLQSTARAALIANDQLLVSNGLGQLQHWIRDSRGVWKREMEGGLDLAGRISTPVLVLPSDNDKHICLGDDSGTLHLFSANRLAPLRQWNLNGKITRGPFLRGSRIGCVVDNRRLVWMDPNIDHPLWQYPPPGEGLPADGISGEPALVGNQVIVSELAGRFVWLDAETGTPRGTQQLQCQAIPTTGGVAVGPNRLLLTLSDGTAILLSQPE
jgi:hypothetical protein